MTPKEYKFLLLTGMRDEIEKGKVPNHQNEDLDNAFRDVYIDLANYLDREINKLEKK